MIYPTHVKSHNTALHSYTQHNYLVAKRTWNKVKKLPWSEDERAEELWLKRIDRLQMEIVGVLDPTPQPSRNLTSQQMWAMRIGGVYPLFHENIIRCLEQDAFPQTQKGKLDWVSQWTSYHCPLVTEDPEIKSQMTLARWERGCLMSPVIDPKGRNVTLSITTTTRRITKTMMHVPHLICNSMYPFTKSILYVDGEIDSNFIRLLEAGWVNEMRRIENNRTIFEPMMRRIFNYTSQSGEEEVNPFAHSNGQGGLLAYAQSYDDCDTEYCLHFDDGISMKATHPTHKMLNLYIQTL